MSFGMRDGRSNHAGCVASGMKDKIEVGERQGSRAVFVYGFDKKDRANIKAGEVEAFKNLPP
jgi:hypothetical protein